MIVYLDVLMIENFFVNLFLLTITLQTLKIKPELKRTMAGAVVGSIYVITMVIPELKLFTRLPFQIAVALIMCFLALKQRSKAFIIKGTVIFILYATALAGLCFYLSVGRNNGQIPQAMLYNFSYKKLLLSIMIIYLLSVRTVIFIRERKQLMHYLYSVNIYMDSVKSTVKVLLDTGNELTDPLTSLPVVIVERRAVNNLKISEHDSYSVPYAAINGHEGILKAVRPDKVEININGTLMEKDVLVAFMDKKISKHNDYNGLLPRGIIEQGDLE